MESLLQDLRFGLRQLVKQPLFTLVAAGALGLGISSVTTQLSVSNGLFIKGLPFPQADQIVHLERIHVERDNFNSEVPLLEFVEWERQQQAFEDLAGFYSGTANLTVGKTVSRYDGSFISASAFELLRAKAYMGRTLQPEDDLPESPDVIVLSHNVWKTDFGSDPSVIGQSAILNGRSVTIVGVMGEGFGFPINEDLWIPLFKQQPVDGLSWGEPSMSLEVFGRLKDGVSMEKARSSMAVVARNLEEIHPDTNRGFRDVRVRPFIEEYLGPETKTMSAVMLLITFLILVIACANVANLLLARSMRRQKEVAIRSALGATRSRIIHQFLSESVLLAAIGSLAGVIMARFSLDQIIDATVELNTPFWMDFHLDWKVLAAVSLITVLTGILSGLVPALRASRCSDCEILKDDTRTSTSLHLGLFGKALVVLQISLAAIILTLVVLFTKSVHNAMSLDYEYNADTLMTARMGLFEEVYPDEQSRANFIGSLLVKLNSHPSITHASTTDRHGFLQAYTTYYEMPGRNYADDSEREIVRYQQVSPGFFETVGLPIHSGRNFLPGDFVGARPRHAIINRAFAAREWPNDNPLGKRFRPQLPGLDLDSGEVPYLEVIGIAGAMNELGVMHDAEEDGAAFFIPQCEGTMAKFVTVIVSGTGEPADLLEIMREEVAALDQNLPLYSTGTPREINDGNMAQFTFFASIFTRFGLMAAFLAAIGIYGVITFSVNQRIMEFGIRQALGATRGAVFKLVYRHAFRQLGMGFLIAFALLSPLILSPGLRDSMTLFFYEIDPESLLPYLISFGFVAGISLVSAAPPAFRAARIEPAQALRYE